jgi:hypothetical protein
MSMCGCACLQCCCCGRQAPLGYGLTGIVTTIDSGTSRKRISSYYRRTVNVALGRSATGTASLDLYVDDGAVVYLNGVEVLRWNMNAGAVGMNVAAASKVCVCTASV